MHKFVNLLSFILKVPSEERGGGGWKGVKKTMHFLRVKMWVKLKFNLKPFRVDKVMLNKNFLSLELFLNRWRWRKSMEQISW